MTSFRLIIQSFRHYLKENFWVAIGVAITTAVLTGALIVGDSLIYSLEQSAQLRLGKITHAVTSGDRFFTTDLSKKLNQQGIASSAVLKLEAIASADGGQMKQNNVQVWGIDETFPAIAGGTVLPMKDNEGVRISSNLALRLNLFEGDEMVLRIKKATLIPANAPFVSDAEQTVTYRAKIEKIVSNEELGRLSLQNSQTAPFNLFLPLQKLNKLMGLENKANGLLFSTTDNEQIIKEAIRSSFTLEDGGLTVGDATITDQWELRSDRVFIDDVVVKAVENAGLHCHPIFTYFANRFTANGNETPYSFISTLDSNQLGENDIVINRWLASDLNAKTGDSLLMSYFNIGPLRELTENTKKFRVEKVVEMKGYFADQSLMPRIPGLSDAQNCRDWQTGVPINLKSIRDKDEDYWYNYKGLPKAFISFSVAQKLWGNRYGSVTAFRFSKEEISKEELAQIIRDQVDPFELCFNLQNVKEEGLLAAKQGTDFSSLFIGLSFFIIAAALILTALLFRLNLEKRNLEIGTLSALGFSNARISKLFLIEGLFVAISGGIMGLGLAFAYNELIFWGLNRVWNDIVRTDVLVTRYHALTLFIGLIISIVVSITTIWISLQKALKRTVVQLQRRQKLATSKKKKMVELVLVLVFTGFAAGVVVHLFVNRDTLSPGLVFTAGGFLLIAFLLAFGLYLSKQNDAKTKPVSIRGLVVENLRQSRSRSFVILILLAITTFIIVTTGLNRQDLFGSARDPKSGTGGFLFVAESTMPLLHNLNDPMFRTDQGFSVDFGAVPFHVAQGDDASCLNLNRISNPRVLGVDASQLKGRFSFQTFAAGQPKDNDGWNLLQKDEKGCIPAIADQTVIQWSLGKKIGDTLIYRNSKGEEIRLRLVAGLKPSVFQGNVIIDNQSFLDNFTSSSGSYFFLIDGETTHQQAIADELEFQFRDLGFEMVPAAQRLAEFKSIENTYLSIFLILGALGLLIGTIGLAVIVVRSLLERKAEFSLLASLGIQQKMIEKLVVSEYLILLFIGILTGFISAIVSVLPVIISSLNDISLWFVLLLISVVIVNGMLWILFLSRFQLRKVNLLEDLRN
ncbi:MAG TPA: ABC transporter permease, partial [Prolixibacteraceae bacterium]|nr:ABC transporter permease [Prolixibacteraceae bacterium]